MTTGMLWFDNSKSSLNKKIGRARDYYTKKYGQAPNLCLVHPSMFEDKPNEYNLEGLTVRPYRPVLPGHIWIGMEDEQS